MELHPNPSCSYFSSFSSMHHPYLHWEAKLQRLLVIITQLPSRYPGLNHQIFLALLPSQPELDEEEPPLRPVLLSSPFGFPRRCAHPDPQHQDWPITLPRPAAPTDRGQDPVLSSPNSLTQARQLRCSHGFPGPTKRHQLPVPGYNYKDGNSWLGQPNQSHHQKALPVPKPSKLQWCREPPRVDAFFWERDGSGGGK